jgi:hypothetical protein
MGSHLFTLRSGLNLGIRMRKTYIFLQHHPDTRKEPHHPDTRKEPHHPDNQKEPRHPDGAALTRISLMQQMEQHNPDRIAWSNILQMELHGAMILREPHGNVSSYTVPNFFHDSSELQSKVQ